MQAQAVNAIVITSHGMVEGNWILETSCRDYDQYKTLPDVVEWQGQLCGKTGWNSDRGYACYKSGVPIARAQG